MSEDVHFNSYICRMDELVPGIGPALRLSVNELVKQHLSAFDYNSQMIGLLCGQVQSGKTSQLLGTAARAADEGFSLFVLLTTDSVALQEQTLKRAFDSLDTFSVCGETDYLRFRQGDLRRPTLLILKKNCKVLSTWHTYLIGSGYLQRTPLMIIDDEGDAASLNTKVNRREVSTIHRCLTDIRSSAPSSVYLQVTATPQALLLQTAESGWRPSFAHCFTPGPGYAGGTVFYSDESPCTVLTADDEATVLLNGRGIPAGLRQALFTFIVTAAEFDRRGAPACNMLIHPSVKIADHEHTAKKTARLVEGLLNDLESHADIAGQILSEAWQDLKVTCSTLTPLRALSSYIAGVAKATNIVTMNSVSCTDRDLDSGHNIVIGGNILGRGLTIPHLQTVYYCRQARTPQADTVWQHSRIFGYDRSIDLCRIYLPPQIRKLFRDLSESNETLFSLIESGKINKISINLPNGVRPTRSAVLRADSLYTVTGGVNYFPAFPYQTDPVELDCLLGINDSVGRLSLSTVREILVQQRSEDSYDWDTERFVTCVDSLLHQENYTKDAVAVIRTDRNISRGTGTLLSPQDRALGEQYSDQVVLTAYRLNGLRTNGWDGSPFWVCNIKFPSGICFYSSD